ncbi:MULTISPECIES: hypothetical protein [Paenibacillus]|uniref:hypothetical protein n=1 Tax=Paenibacillus TaxID=44249 RepID=UPI00096C6D4A|nr:hypothetical protein [Paenibacillus odorifer]MEC0130451.1 hypothetical protein [Paenibacillus odorifer]MEC0220662.1 hypothetical protein [Paenibacillus odorifer]OMD07562.1 hypothetical protein BJP50_08480 [Paenibacillus odorifer]
MGTSFANLHVFTNDKEAVLKSLKRLRPKGSYYIGQSQGWTTVLGEKFNWETIGESARSLSNLISSLVLAIGYFDDEVLEIFIYQNGEILDRYAGGDVLEEYEMEPETFDYAAVVERLRLTVSPDSLGVMFQNDDVREIVEQLETVVPAPLILKYDWVEDDESLGGEFVHVRRDLQTIKA